MNGNVILSPHLDPESGIEEWLEACRRLKLFPHVALTLTKLVKTDGNVSELDQG